MAIELRNTRTANCNINVILFWNFLLKMQREWRIAPRKNGDFVMNNGRLFWQLEVRHWGRAPKCRDCE